MGVGFPNFCQQEALLGYLVPDPKTGTKTITFNIDFELLQTQSITMNDDTSNDDNLQLNGCDFDSVTMQNRVVSQIVHKMWQSRDFADITMVCIKTNLLYIF